MLGLRARSGRAVRYRHRENGGAYPELVEHADYIKEHIRRGALLPHHRPGPEYPVESHRQHRKAAAEGQAPRAGGH
ncbi:MAG: hypothetical protein ACLRI7_03365 [Ruthenibacterium lactatiformans]